MNEALIAVVLEKLMRSLATGQAEWHIVKHHTGQIDIYHWGKLVYTHQPQTTA